jgi:hypothetical protein
MSLTGLLTERKRLQEEIQAEDDEELDEEDEDALLFDHPDDRKSTFFMGKVVYSRDLQRMCTMRTLPSVMSWPARCVIYIKCFLY